MMTPLTALERDLLACVERLVTACEVSAKELRGFAAETSFGFARAVSDRGEGAFDGVGGADVRPVFGWEVIEGQQYFERLAFAVLDPTQYEVPGGAPPGLS